MLILLVVIGRVLFRPAGLIPEAAQTQYDNHDNPGNEHVEDDVDYSCRLQIDDKEHGDHRSHIKDIFDNVGRQSILSLCR